MTYPADALPRPQWDGYAISVTGPAVATGRDRGQSRVRRLGLGSLTVATMTWILTDAEYRAWMQWYRETTLYGSQADQMMVKTGKSDELLYVKPLEQPKVEDVDGGWRVTMRLEIHNPPRYTSVQIAAILATQG